jgi:2-iminobutanoate/2-iminopropanoate deaminase
MSNKLVRTLKLSKGPKLIGPYSVAKIHHGVIYVSGQIGFNPVTSKLVSDSVEEQTHQIMTNIQNILLEANSRLENIMKCTVYLTVLYVLLQTMNDFQKMNVVYASFFKEDPPARVCIAVKELPAQAKVEIDVIAAE